jgi:hypothetical protein
MVERELTYTTRITERTILQAKWDRAIEQAGAESVAIVNEVDEELIPSSVDLETFEYLESGPYKWCDPSHILQNYELIDGAGMARLTTASSWAAMGTVTIRTYVNARAQNLQRR